MIAGDAPRVCVVVHPQIWRVQAPLTALKVDGPARGVEGVAHFHVLDGRLELRAINDGIAPVLREARVRSECDDV